MFALKKKTSDDDQPIPGEQLKRLHQLEASALYAHMQLSELLKAIKQPSPFEIQPALKRVEMANNALVEFARKSGLT